MTEKPIATQLSLYLYLFVGPFSFRLLIFVKFSFLRQKESFRVETRPFFEAHENSPYSGWMDVGVEFAIPMKLV